MIVDCAVYRDGRRDGDMCSVDDAVASCRHGGDFVWMGMHEPTAEEFEDVTVRFGLHPLAVEDAIHAHQRPKLERYGDSVFMVLKPARYVDHDEIVEIGQIMLFVGRHFVVTVRHGQTRALGQVRATLEADPQRLAFGPVAVLHAVADRVVDDYGEVMVGLQEDVDDIEQQVFGTPSAGHAERIFKLKREVLEFRRAVEPLADPLRVLTTESGSVDPRFVPYFRDVLDHLLRSVELVVGLDALLDSALNANIASVGMRQNEDMRKISAWVAIAAVPTMLAGIYGMNFEHMPELDWILGYPVVLCLMGLVCYGLYRNFKRRDWL